MFDGAHILVLMGAEGAGKSTLAAHLVRNYGYTEFQFATKLRAAVVELWNGFVADVAPLVSLPTLSIADTEDQGRKERPIDGRISVTPRNLMQRIGTDVMRKCVADDIWVHATLHGMQAAYAKGTRRFVVSDCRFVNEHAALDTLRAEGAIVTFVRIIRGDREAAIAAALAKHVSSQGWVFLTADFEFQNTLTQDWLETVATTVTGGLESTFK